MWLTLSLLTAFFHSVKDIACKHVLKDLNEYVVVVGINFLGLPFLVLFSLYRGIYPDFTLKLCMVVLSAAIIDTVGTLLYLKGIKASDLSLSLPLINFTPLFLLITSPLIINEIPNAMGFSGVILIVLGSWILNLNKWKDGLLAPFQVLLVEKGPRYILCVAFLWSISSNIHKIGLDLADPIFYSTLLVALRSFFLFFVMLKHSPQNLPTLKASIKRLFPIGVLLALVFVCQMLAMELILVSYVISIKRLSVICSIVFAHFLFREENLRDRLAGALVMIAGVLLISFSE